MGADAGRVGERLPAAIGLQPRDLARVVPFGCPAGGAAAAALVARPGATAGGRGLHRAAGLSLRWTPCTVLPGGRRDGRGGEASLSTAWPLAPLNWPPPAFARDGNHAGRRRRGAG